MKNNENPTLCKQCENCCCQKMPGIYSPKDIMPISADALAAKLAAGEWAIDWWEADKPLQYVRPATKTGPKILDPSWGGECFYFTEAGCSLTFSQRPSNCQALKPGVDKCDLPDKYSKHSTALAWQKHHQLLSDAIGKAENML